MVRVLRTFIGPGVGGWSRLHDHVCIENNSKRLALGNMILGVDTGCRTGVFYIW